MSRKGNSTAVLPQIGILYCHIQLSLEYDHIYPDASNSDFSLIKSCCCCCRSRHRRKAADTSFCRCDVYYRHT